MTVSKIIEIGVMEGIALFLFVLAYAIGVKKKMELIAGYSERTADRVRDKHGLARFIARVCISIGLASALMPVVTYLWGGSSRGMALCIGGYGGFIMGSIVLTMLQAREYTSPRFGTEEKK